MIERGGFNTKVQLREYERLSLEDKRSVDILSMLQKCGTFAERNNKVRLFVDSRASSQLADIEIDHFIDAVYFFCLHRASTTRVNRELLKEDGLIPLYGYGPFDEDNSLKILCKIHSHKAFEMLEFAFLLARKKLKS